MLTNCQAATHVYPQVEWAIPAFTPQPQSITAHFGWYSFPVPLRAGGWVGLRCLVKYWGGYVVCPPKTVTHPSTNRARRRVTSLTRPTTLPLHHAATTMKFVFWPHAHYIWYGKERDWTEWPTFPDPFNCRPTTRNRLAHIVHRQLTNRHCSFMRYYILRSSAEKYFLEINVYKWNRWWKY